MQGFKPSEIITDPNLLFGRNESGNILDQLFTNLKRGTNCELNGEKRMGKTSTLKCLQKKIDAEDSQLLPIYLNFKEDNWIQGNSEVYKYIISKVLDGFNRRKIISEKLEFSGIEIVQHKDWMGYFELMKNVVDYRTQSLFKEIVLFLSEYYQKSIALLIDEYEFLFKYSFDTPQGFFIIRSLSEEPSKNNIKPLSYIIAGSSKSSKVCSEIGSPELNTLGAGVIYLPPLRQNSFKEMWEYSRSFIPGIEKFQVFEAKYMYDLSGGIPFYAKFIGESAINGQTVNYTILSTFFENVLHNLTDEERDLVTAVAGSSQIPISPLINILIDKGILRESSDLAFINGKFFKEFLQDKLTFRGEGHSDNRFKVVIENVKIFRKHISSINNNSFVKTGKLIYDVTHEVDSMYLDLEKVCVDVEDIKSFSSIIYINMIERVSKPSLNKLPNLLTDRAIADNNILNIIDSLRNCLMHFNYRAKNNQLSRTELWKMILGKESEPSNKDDFYIIQKFILEKLNDYLLKVSAQLV